MVFCRHFLSLASLVLAFALMACGRSALPPLLTVESIGPVQVEVGEKVEILGSGFPAGRVARLTLRGELARPGEDVEERVEITLSGNAISPSKIELDVDEEVGSTLAGQARHATFRGELEVAFASTSGPPVYGVLSRALIDVRSTHIEAEEHASTDGEAFLRAHGIGTERDASGVRVLSVEPHSAADQAGLVAGDRLVGYEGLRVLEPADFAHGASRPLASLTVRRGVSGAEEDVRLEVRQDSLRPGAIVVWGASGLLLFSIVLSLLLSKHSPVLLSLARTLRTRGRIALAYVSMRRGEVVALGIVMTLFAVVPLARYWVVRDIDCLLLVALLVGFHLWLLMGGAFRAMPRALLASLPLATLMMGLLFVLGSLRLEDAIRHQGALPWQWAVLHDPVRFALFVLFALLVTQRSARTTPPVLTTLTQAIASGFATLVFLGGWRIPTFMNSLHMASWSAVFGIVVFVLKCLVLFAALRWFRALQVPRPLADLSRDAYRRALPFALVLLGCLRWMDSVHPGDMTLQALRLVTAALGALALIRLGSAMREVGRLPTT